MPILDERVTAWMRTHQGTVPTTVLEAIGVTAKQRDHLVAAGILTRVLHGCYRFSGTQPSELMRCAALCATHPHLVIAGPTAGREWKIRKSPHDDVIHAIGPPRSQPCIESWVAVYRTPLRSDEIVCRSDGIRFTCPPRTVIDLARFLGDDDLASAIEYVLSERICTYDTLLRYARRIEARGRPWVRRFIGILEARKPGRARESDWERRVFDALVGRGVVDLESQVWESVPGYGPARFDMAVPALQWVLEVDVHPEHRTLGGQRNDHSRDRKSKRIGWQTDRVGESELRAAFDETLDDVAASVAQRRVEVAALSEAGLWPPRAMR